MNTMTYAVGGSWAFFALLSIGIAISKNRSALNWFLLTMLFGPLALLSLVFQRALVADE